MKHAVALLTIVFFCFSSPLLAQTTDKLAPQAQVNGQVDLSKKWGFITNYLEDYKNNYPGPIIFQNVPAATALTAPSSNENTVLSYPNQDQPSVQQTFRTNGGDSFVDNGTSTHNHPNQNQPKNETLINNRLRAMGL